MLNNNIETFIGCDAPYGEASIVLFGATVLIRTRI